MSRELQMKDGMVKLWLTGQCRLCPKLAKQLSEGLWLEVAGWGPTFVLPVPFILVDYRNILRLRRHINYGEVE